jgi:pyruvate dehydrogenase E1 component
MVHHANFGRENADGTKIGGHQASSSSAVTLLTALYFKALRPGDVVAVKAHASPVFYACHYLRGTLEADDLRRLRQYGGLQAYPSRARNRNVVDLTTGSMGLGAVSATFGGLATRYLADHFGTAQPERFIVMVGDAELDEGNVWEALQEETVSRLGNVLWIVDLNRQSLDRIVPDSRRRHITAMFRTVGWRVIELRWGGNVMKQPRLRERLEAMSHAEYQSLLCLPPDRVRALTGVDKALVADVGGHDLAAVLGAYAEAETDAQRPTVIIADTIKGWGLPFAGDPLNHGMLLTAAQLEALRQSLGAPADDPLPRFPADSVEGRHIAGLPLLFRPPAGALSPRVEPPAVAPDPARPLPDRWLGRVPPPARELSAAGGSGSSPRPAGAPECSGSRAERSTVPGGGPRWRPELPAALGEKYSGSLSTQEAFGRVLGALGRLPVVERLVTVSADVAITTHLAGWINRHGVYFPDKRPDYFGERGIPQAMQWRESPGGRHIELGIAEHNLFLLLTALGLADDLSGEPLLAVGTLYDPFVTRGLDALLHALYSGARFVIAATPSGVSLSPEGGAHQSVITPSIGIALPRCTYYEPTFALDTEWILLDGLRRIAAGTGESLYLRLSTKPIDQALRTLAPSGPDPAPALTGAYRIVDRGRPDVTIWAAGVMVPEAIAAARALEAEGVRATVFAVTSPDLLYRGYAGSRRVGEASSVLDTLVRDEEAMAPLVSVLDGHSHALAFLGSALGTLQAPLGVDDFGQSGSRADLYRHYGIDAEAIARAARGLLE